MTEKLSQDGWHGFIELCAKIQSPEEMRQLFDLFFTIEEKETFSSRFTIVKTLLEGNLTQREISETHKVSIAQITRGSNALKIISPELKSLLKKRLK